MPLLPEHTTLRRVESDNPMSAKVYFSIDLLSPLGNVVLGPMEPVEVTLTEEELVVFGGLVSRCRQLYCDRKNAEIAPPTP